MGESTRGHVEPLDPIAPLEQADQIASSAGSNQEKALGGFQKARLKPLLPQHETRDAIVAGTELGPRVSDCGSQVGESKSSYARYIEARPASSSTRPAPRRNVYGALRQPRIRDQATGDLEPRVGPSCRQRGSDYTVASARLDFTA